MHINSNSNNANFKRRDFFALALSCEAAKTDTESVNCHPLGNDRWDPCWFSHVV